jgi:hypothetical protein
MNRPQTGLSALNEYHVVSGKSEVTIYNTP